MKRFTSPTAGLLLFSLMQAACSGAGSGTDANGSANPVLNGTSGSAGAATHASAGSSGAGTAGGVNGGGSHAGTPTAPQPGTDSDSDGVADDRDLCPGTSAGVRVNASGCDATSDTTAQTPWGQAIAQPSTGSLPVSGSVENNGFMSFVVDKDGKFPMVFRALASNVTKLEHGFHVTGSLLLDVPGGTLTLAEADVEFEYGETESYGLKTLHGTARVPFPDFGAPEKLELEAPIAELALEEGKDLKELKAPLVDDRRYLAFNFSDKLGAKFGDLEVAVPAGTEHTLVLDHTDPMFFVRASLTGIPGMPIQIKDAGVGFSRQGRLPFTPEDTYPLSEEEGAAAHGFSGQMYLQMAGGVEIPETHVLLTGESVNVIDIDPGRTGRTVFTDPTVGLRLGANRALGLKLELIPGTAGIELEMGEGSLDLALQKDKQSAFASGWIYPGKSFFNDVVPILPSAAVKVAATVADPIGDSSFACEGDVSLELSKLNDISGLSLSDVPLAHAMLNADKNGLYISGKPNASFLQALGIGADATFEAAFPGDAASSAWYVDVKGEIRVSGIELDGQTKAHLDRSGVQIDGRLATALSVIAMSGRIDRSGVNVAGSAEVTIPITTPGRTELQNIANGAICGYKTVTDGAICGFDTISGFAACGVNYAKQCILHHHCGTPTCIGAARSCKDLNQPLSCPQEVNIPAATYGTFKGAVAVKIGSNGLEASVVGSYCTTGGACQALPPGTVDLSSSKACVQVPRLPGSFCANF